MGYSATIYYSDSGITYTTVYNYLSKITVTREYGSSYTTVSDMSGDAIFSATVSSDKNFYRWVYREESTSGTVQYSYDNPFIYNSGKDIFIHADSKDVGNEPEWGVCVSGIGAGIGDNTTIINNAQRYVDISARNIYCFAMQFDNPGTATFYSAGYDDDVEAWLSSSTLTFSFNTELGRPTNYHAHDDDSAGNRQFQISYDVNRSPVYYLWIRMHSSEESGHATLYVNVSGESGDIPTYVMQSIRKAHKQELLFGAGDAYRIAISFAMGGKPTFYTEGNCATYGYLSTSNTWDRNYMQPYPDSSILARSSYGGSGDNFKIQYDYGVNAETTYYVYVKLTNPQATGRATFYVIPPSATLYIPYWSWQVTNGSASTGDTHTAYSSLMSRGAVSLFSHKVWNDMCDKVNDILELIGDQWYLEYASFNETKMTENDRTLTAKRFNSLRANIGRHCPTGINQVYSGDTVKADYFLTLAAKINEWIDGAVQELQQ